MTGLTARDLKKAILQLLNAQAQVNKFNLIGRTASQRGVLEHHLGTDFEAGDRALAARSFEELRRDEYLQATYRDLADPENWVAITSAGREFLARDLKDSIDLGLERISPHLVEIRQGMRDAVDRTSPDAPRQAAHSARELLSQLLKEGAPAECSNRKDRFRFLMRQNRGGTISNSDLEIIEASCDLVEAEHNKLIGSAHARQSVHREDVLASVAATERILRLIFRIE